MGTFVTFTTPTPYNARTVILPDARRTFRLGAEVAYSRQSLPDDAVGTFYLTLTNIAVGSRVHVDKQSDGTSFYDDVAASSTVVIPLSAYASGSPYNDLRIKVRKASSGTTYQPWETLATAVVGSSSIYVSQIPDE